MVAYIKELVTALLAALDPKTKGDANPFALAKALAEELDRLDPRDFAPAARFPFVAARAEARVWAHATSMSHTIKLVTLAQTVAQLLDAYGPPCRRGSTRVFRWLSDTDLRAIVQRDYAELEAILMPDGAWKSAVVSAGSILEAVLVDLLTKDAARLAAAKVSAKVPKDKSVPKPEADWTLHNLIEIATDIGLIPKERAKTFDQVLRDYRNFVHPRKEIRAAHPCGEGEASMAKGALDALCDHFDRTLP
jgi:hypothetical protein